MVHFLICLLTSGDYFQPPKGGPVLCILEPVLPEIFGNLQKTARFSLMIHVK